MDRKLRPHVDYLPTQIVTEFFRTSVFSKDREPILGVRYSSSKNGRDAVVLFAENGDVYDGPSDCVSADILTLPDDCADVLRDDLAGRPEPRFSPLQRRHSQPHVYRPFVLGSAGIFNSYQQLVGAIQEVEGLAEREGFEPSMSLHP
ncbi:hypothetical protein FJQ54_10445 [Sandaracinobacter neustonicus]|uniref:Uncharacterized protein n=1 Tax=Sandaracinobacter neustonicus TaxID=1715348 RepID=A0A501XJ73_9SPHN|nr:hypothetical protein FJQ54_10445 [Sandaracinobacter neustonicus]